MTARDIPILRLRTAFLPHKQSALATRGYDVSAQYGALTSRLAGCSVTILPQAGHADGSTWRASSDFCDNFGTGAPQPPAARYV
jgi:hypothetical protein